MPGESVKIFEQYLDYSTIKQKLVAKNISNISTLNYKREDMSFDDYLRETEKNDLKTTNANQYEFGITINGNKPEDKAIVQDDNPEWNPTLIMLILTRDGRFSAKLYNV
jgi:flagellar basal-body rod protein FlgB